MAAQHVITAKVDEAITTSKIIRVEIEEHMLRFQAQLSQEAQLIELEKGKLAQMGQ